MKPAKVLSDAKIAVTLGRLARVCAVAIFAVGAVVLLGWVFDVGVLKSLSPHFVTMKVNTAVCFALAGLSLWLVQPGRDPLLRYRCGQVCAAAVALIGILTILEYLFGVNLRIDQFFIAESPGAVFTSHLGRMALNTAMSFTFLGIAILSIDVETPRGMRPAPFLAIAGLAFCIFTFVGYITGVGKLATGGVPFTMMALHTAAAFFLAFVGLLCARPDRGLMKRVVAPDLVGTRLRRVLPVAVLLPLLLGLLYRSADFGIFSHAFGVALMIMGSIFIFTLVIWWNASQISRVEALRQQTRKERDRFFNLSLDMLCIAGFDGVFKQLNPAWERSLGWTKDVLLSKPLIEFVHPDDRIGTIEAMRTLSAGSPVHAFENRYRCKDGSYKWISWSSFPLIEEKLIYAVARDVTESKRMVELLRDAKRKAEASDQAKSDFLANMSHELRTPLNSIIGFGEVLADRLFGPLNEKQQTYVANVLESAQHLLSLINDVLDLSKVEAGRMDFVPTAFALRDALESSVGMFREKAAQHRIALSLAMTAQEDLTITADERKLKQILFNLLSNAMKFTPDGGAVTVTAKTVRDSTIGEIVEISVADTGIGIKQEDLPKLFGGYVQLETTYAKGYQGTGLGLALVKGFAELHGGTVSVESGYGRGSTFTVRIPLAPKQPGDA